MIPQTALAGLPAHLREDLLHEYQHIVQNYSEHRWLPAELSGGRFCEIALTIIDGYAAGSYTTKPRKIANFVAACRSLEQHTHLPRSLRILIPRLLPALFEVRNNRGVGHIGADVESNYMDATFVVTSCNWVMGELVRVFHNLTTKEAQDLVDNLVERRSPILWEQGGVRRVLNTKLKMWEKILLLIGLSTKPVNTSDLYDWIEAGDASYFRKLLRKIHSNRQIELSRDGDFAQILPPGGLLVAEIVKKQQI